jgi:hypothetical protein
MTSLGKRHNLAVEALKKPQSAIGELKPGDPQAAQPLPDTASRIFRAKWLSTIQDIIEASMDTLRSKNIPECLRCAGLTGARRPVEDNQDAALLRHSDWPLCRCRTFIIE